MKFKALAAYFYRSTVGNEPVRDWLKRLNKEEKKTIGHDIQTVQYGWPLGMPLVRNLGDGLWEIRSTLSSSKIARVIFFMHHDTMILLHGFIKKTQKTPPADIALAKRRMNEVIKHEKK
ncbi:MAG: type II toxin-antitoxin system RelE/ParE family toxin [Gammaproteobacteria bacterium]